MRPNRASSFIGVLIAFAMALGPFPLARALASDHSTRETAVTNVRASRIVERAKRIVFDAQQLDLMRSEPPQGPAIRAGVRVAYLHESLINGGVQGVLQGMQEAAYVAGWTVTALDASGGDTAILNAVEKAIQLDADAIVLGGGDAVAIQTLIDRSPLAERFSRMPVFAWHGGPMPGRIPGSQVLVNVTTNSSAVAELAATLAVADSDGKAGVVILTDNRFAIARQKAQVMQDVIASCQACRVLNTIDVAIPDAVTRMPTLVRELRQRFGQSWTHTLVINDIYFDAMHKVPEAEGLRNISAGDGSAQAFERLVDDDQCQFATVPEPLLMQGWQLVDEINRHLNGVPPSGFVPPVAVVTPANVKMALSATNLFDPPIGYRHVYQMRWSRPGG